MDCFEMNNEQSTRSFVCLPVADREGGLQKLVDASDEVLRQFRQPTYYDKPIFHVSIASFPTTSATARPVVGGAGKEGVVGGEESESNDS